MSGLPEAPVELGPDAAVASVELGLDGVGLDGVGLGVAVGRWVMTGFYDPVHGLEP
jgi:hypothetical protein